MDEEWGSFGVWESKWPISKLSTNHKVGHLSECPAYSLGKTGNRDRVIG